MKDIDLEEVLEIFTKFARQKDEEEADLVAADNASETKSTRIGNVLGPRRVSFDASVTELSRSANHRAHKKFSLLWSPSSHDGAFIVVRSLNRWCDSALEQDYAVAVSLRRDEGQA